MAAELYEFLLSARVVANLIKSYINPNAIFVVGGYHPSIFPEEFQSDYIPDFIYEHFPKCENLFNFLIKGEGEIILSDGKIGASAKGSYLKLPISKIADFDLEENEWKIIKSPDDPEFIDV